MMKKQKNNIRSSVRMAVLDGTVVPDTVPENLVPVTLIS